jgi:pyruvate,orthophosphate dikinase
VSTDAFVHDVVDLDAADTTRFGGKGAGLARMCRLGLPVPPAFVIDTNACRWSREHGGALPPTLPDEIESAIAALERGSNRTFGGSDGVPLLVSVRSGAKVSMPGMMDTILNLGLDRESVLRLADEAGNPAFAVDSWMRFWAMFSDIVLDVDGELLRETVEDARAAAVEKLTPTTAAALEAEIVAFLDAEGVAAPLDPREQLRSAVGAVFRSWDSRRAKTYRAHHGIPDDLGTAVVVQAMVFGNLGPSSGSGVCFTRDPKSGEPELYGEYLAGGQGEEVVAGTRTPVDLREPSDEWAGLRAELEAHGRTLEREYRDALDIEFTVQDGTLYLLQVRPAKRTAAAAVRVATDLLAEGVIEEEAALARVTAEQVRRLVSPEFDAEAVAAARAGGALLTTGIGASPGHGSGVAVLDADRAATLAAEGTDVVLVRPTTSPQDLRGMLAATAVLTARGGATSHAAVVSRALDKPCVVGCSELDVRPDDRVFLLGGREFPEGAELSVDGATGSVYAGVLPRSVPERFLGPLASLLDVADRRSEARVWLPVATPAAVADAISRGARGIGVIGLTDLLVTTGGVARLVNAITALSNDPDAPSSKVEELVEDEARIAVRAILEASGGVAVDLRLPVLTSPRARRLIEEWASLAPHLLLPLGTRRLLVAFLRAVSAAAREAGHRAATVLIGGVTNAAEIDAFADLASAHDNIATGAVLSNPTVLFRPEALPRAERALWVDLHELTRAAHGYPDELLFTISELSAPGATASPGEGVAPGSSLNPLVRHQLDELIRTARGSGRIGVDMAGAAHSGIAPELYRAGFRNFTSASGQAEELRLLLGQGAGTEEDHDG